MAIKIAGNRVLDYDALSFSNTNIAVGHQALNALTTGVNNTAVGRSALEANTTGVFNTAVGFLALVLNTTGSENTAVGGGALSANVTGIGNTALGRAALAANTTGNFNEAVGYLTLTANTIGTDNVAMGTQALTANTTGYSNTAVGRLALFSNTIGYQNTALGVNSLRTNTTGFQNTAIGGQALYDQTTGTVNTALGFNTGRGITTGSKNTIIGANVTGLSATLANTVIIADGDGNQRIYVDNTGRVGIGTTSPKQLLHVAGQGLFTSSTTSFDPGDSAGSAVRIGYNTSGDFGYVVSSNTGVTVKNLLISGDRLQFDAGGSERMRILSTGEIGIGTASPKQLLHVAGQGVFTTSAATYDTGDSAGPAVRIGYNTSGDYGYVVSNNTGTSRKTLILDASSIQFLTAGGAERMRILLTGEVGIGTASPDASAKLHVEGNLGVNRTIYSPQRADLSNVFIRFIDAASQSDANGDLTVSAFYPIIFQTGGDGMALKIERNGNLTTRSGASLTSGTWTNSSDVANKSDLAPVDPEVILTALEQMPVQSWRYTEEDPTVRHIGPTAQDFYTAFGLGQSDKQITTIDGQGVLLAAVQALSHKLKLLEMKYATTH